MKIEIREVLGIILKDYIVFHMTSFKSPNSWVVKNALEPLKHQMYMMCNKFSFIIFHTIAHLWNNFIPWCYKWRFLNVPLWSRMQHCFKSIVEDFKENIIIQKMTRIVISFQIINVICNSNVLFKKLKSFI